VGVKGIGFGDMEYIQLDEDRGLWLKLKFL
jgi:hypothetical protein